MKIHNNKIIFTGNGNSTNSIKKEYLQNTQKSIETSFLNILSNQSKAFLNISFKNNNSKAKESTDKIEIKELSDKEFKAYKRNLWKRLIAFPLNIQYGAKQWELNKYNIQIANKIFSDDKLYNNPLIIDNLSSILGASQKHETAQAKADIIDKIFSDKRLYGNGKAMNILERTISGITTSEKAKAKADIIDKIFSDDRLCGNEKFMDNSGWIIQDTITQEQAKLKSDIIDIILSEEELYKNLENLSGIINVTDTPEQYDLAKRILSEKKFYNNENLMHMAARIIASAETKEEVEAKFNIINKIYSDKRLYNNKNIIDCAEYLIRDVKTAEEAQVKSDIIDKILSDERIYGNENVINNLERIISNVKSPEQVKLKSDIIDFLLSEEKELYKDENIIKHTGEIINTVNNPDQYKLAEKILLGEELHNNEDVMKHAEYIIRNVDNIKKYFLANKIFSEEELYNNKEFMKYAGSIIRDIDNSKQYKIAKKILSNKELYNNQSILKNADLIINNIENPKQFKLADKFMSEKELYERENIIYNIASIIDVSGSPERYELANKILSEKELYTNKIIIYNAKSIIAYCSNPDQFKIAKKILSNKELYKNDNIIDFAQNIIISATNPKKYDIANKILSDEKLYTNNNIIKNLGSLLHYTCMPEHYELLNRFLFDERLNVNNDIFSHARKIIEHTETSEQAEARIKVIDKILSDERIYGNETFMQEAGKIIYCTETPEQAEAKSKFIDIILSEDKKLYNNKKVMDNAHILMNAVDTLNQVSKTEKAFDYYIAGEITIKQIINMIYCKEEISGSQIKKLNDLLGIEKTSKLSADEIVKAITFIDIINKKNIYEIPIKAKHEFLRNLVSSNIDLFNLKSNIMSEHFPLLPKNQTEYGLLLPKLIKSMGIETNTLTPEQISCFNQDITDLSKKLASLTDKEFNNLVITQKYNKDKFITDVWKTVKDLPSEEQQKLYDCFGFELNENPETTSRHSIIGYPFNSDKAGKLSQITDKNTINAANLLSNYIDKFSKNNSILCNNKEIEDLLNKIIDVLPELRPQIGKLQAGNIKKDGTIAGYGSHEFDIFKHSLKVMQKIAQDEKFNNLNESDKKVMLLASLLHDITKSEGYTDHTHPKEGSFDSFFIAKKFDLTRDEEIKLNELIKHHEWLSYVNSAKGKNELSKRLKNTAYDLRHDNMLEMSLIFTHADLKAVKRDNSFHDKTDGRGRRIINGELKSFGESADYYAKEIEKLIKQLKPSQPILPVTPFPKADTVDKAITNVNTDGSTNIKGVYKDKDGLIIIKYSELENEDLGKIGFPEGSIVKGIITKTGMGEEVNTGNVKFFAHGLDYPNQLTKFDAFSLVDSDALLSVSYAECPESQYRFYRPQGILLDCDTKFIHGGGETDSGSGCGKDIQEFKDNYIFGGCRQKDRTFISALIKRALKINDTKYIEFVKNNENKSFVDIEPEELRTNIIKAFTSINSRPRIGKRRYNEIYISNPKPPMAVFAYNINYNEEVGNPIKFLNRTTITKQECNYDENGGISVYDRTNFLREYALQHNIPFVVFGD